MTSSARKPRSIRPTSRPDLSLETARAVCPDELLADRIADAFGLDQVASGEIRERSRSHLIEMSQMLQDHLHEKALALHLQRVVGAFVGSAVAAGRFYGSKVDQARALGSRHHDEHLRRGQGRACRLRQPGTAGARVRRRARAAGACAARRRRRGGRSLPAPGRQ